MSEWKISRTIVGKEDLADRQVVAYVGKDGDMGMHVHDLRGPAGRNEYEYFTWVKKKHRDALFLALMDKLFGDRQSCASGFEELMKKNDIPCERFREWRESKTIVGDEDSASRQVVAYVDKDGSVGLQVHDLGGPRGREDSEFYVEVKAGEKDRVVIALMEKLFAGKDSCPEDFRSLMEKNGVPCELYVI
jgi:hypothetical protein